MIARGYGYGLGSGDGSGSGSGYGYGDGSGYGYGYGYGLGFGAGYGAGVSVDGPLKFSCTVPWPGYVQVGCRIHSIDTWRRKWRKIAKGEGVSVAEDAAEEILAAAEAVTMEQVAASWR